VSTWPRFFLVLCGLALAVLLHAAALDGQFSNELYATDYDCRVTLEPAAALGAVPGVRLSLETGEGNSSTLLLITRNSLKVYAVISGQRRLIARMASGVVPGTPYRLTVMRREGQIRLMHDEVLLWHGDVPHPGGALAAAVADNGWTIRETRIQRIEPVVFSDDFMRDTGDASPWTRVSGRWVMTSAWDAIPHGAGIAAAIMNHSHEPDKSQAQNPFAWVGSGDAGVPAVCTTGNTFWEDYTCSVSIKPAPRGACGVLVNISGADALLVRWTPANDRTPGGNAITLCRYDIITGKRTTLDSSAGGYIPGQWYRLSVVSSLGGMRVLVDGQERLAQQNVVPWRGAIGLYAEGSGGTIFDDAAVYGRMLNTDLLLESTQSQITQRFINDPGMKDWVINQREWSADNSVANFYWRRQELYGDHTWMTMTIKPAAIADGELWMTLNGDGKNPNSGYRAIVKINGTPAKIDYALLRDSTVLMNKTGKPLEANTEYALNFRHVGNRIRLEVDGETVIEAAEKAAPLPGMRPAYRKDGAAFANASGISVRGYNTLDYSFSEAPVDWLAEGTWEPSIRWSCSPDWSFLAGWSRGNAVLWHKKRFSGDQTLEAYVGTKMDYKRETNTYLSMARQGYFAVTLCGDGKDPRSGYAGIYGYPDENGMPVGRAVILRNGEVVASIPVIGRSWASNHRAWFNLQMEKRGNTVNFTACNGGDKYQLSFTDDKPMDDGIPALWTYDNAMTVARARLDFANTPAPRADHQVVIANPWYPEWANQDVPLTLDLSESWSAAGKPITWTITPAGVPPGDAGAVAISNGRLSFLPTQPGKHWYRIAAVDGEAKSPDFHLSLPVFNPALKRDDSHALVLYRFDEGDGVTLHDRGAVAPALDLTITPDPNCVQWLPGQGVTMRGGAKAFSSSIAADKLLALGKTKAATLECWASADTLFSSFGRSSCFFSWEPPQPGGNVPLPFLGFCSGQDYLQLATGGAPFANLTPGFMTSLHHVAVTWDGATTTSYIDGVKMGESALPWNPEQWTTGAKLYVGNQQNDLRPLIGQLYLLAIHDRCFSADEVLRHVKAGPSA